MKLAKYLFLLLIVFNFNVLSQKNITPIEVKANVLVVDSNDQSIDDVKIENFKVFEDGVEQKITSFTKKEPILNLAMVFDNSGSVKYEFNEMLICGKIITENLSEKDEAVVIRFVSSDKIEVTQDFTNDKKLLSEAIENLYVEEGQTAVLDAIYLSAEKLLIKQKVNPSNRYAILLFSDAEERDSY